MSRRQVMTAVTVTSLAAVLAASAALMLPGGGGAGDRVAGGATAEALGWRAPGAPPTTVRLPPLPSNTGPDATYDVPFAPPETMPDPSASSLDTAVVVAPTGVIAVTDDLGMLTVDLPLVWGDVDTSPAGANPAISAAADWAAWSNWSAPGVVYVAYPLITDPLAVLAADELAAACTALAPEPITERGYGGIEQVFVDCGDAAKARNHVWIVQPDDAAYSLYVNVQTLDDDATGDDLVAGIRASFDTIDGVALPAEATSAAETPPTVTVPSGSDAPVPASDVPASDVPTTVSPPTAPPEPSGPGGGPAELPNGYVELVDNTGTLRLAVPASWTDTDGSSTLLESGARTFSLAASTDLRGLQQRYDVAGVYVTGFEHHADPARLLARYAPLPTRECATSSGAQSFANAHLVGVQQRWSDCDGTGYDFVVVVANPLVASRAGGHTVVLFAQLPSAETYTLDVLTSSLLLVDKV